MSRRFSDLAEFDADERDPVPLRNRSSVSEDVYEALLTQLIMLRIPPGERISVDALARDFGVSQTPIRAALIRLETEGLVLRKHNAGYGAAPIPSAARFRDLYEFRMLVEPAAAAMATDRMSDAQSARLLETSRELELCLTEGPTVAYGRFAILDARFHEIIAESCGNEMVVEALGRLYTHLHLFRLRHHTIVTEEAVKEHRRIMTAMSARDADAAAVAMRHHIALSQERMEPFYKPL